MRVAFAVVISQQLAQLHPPPTHPTQLQIQSQPKPIAIAKTYETLGRLGVNAFFGTGDPFVADSWLRAIKKAFNLLRNTDEEKFKYVVFLLKDEASYWWESMEQRYLDASLTWIDFQREFQERYYPKTFRDAKRREFTHLRQRNMTVPEFE